MNVTCYQYLSDTEECKEKGIVLIILDFQYENSKFRKSKTMLNFKVLFSNQASSPFYLRHV